jgi:hypothetical protein
MQRKTRGRPLKVMVLSVDETTSDLFDGVQ